MGTTSQEQITSLAVQAMAYSAFAAAMGAAMVSMGAITGVAEVPEPAVRDLRQMFGTKIVNDAIKSVGKDDVTRLAHEIDRLFVADLRTRYGDYATDSALAVSPPGELRKVEEVARVLAGQHITSATPVEKREQAMEVAKRKARKKAPPVPQRDTETGVVYKSKFTAYSALAAEFGKDPTDHWGIYNFKKEHPGRLVDTTREQYDKYIAAQTP